MMLAYRFAHAKEFLMDVLGMKGESAKTVPKLLNFELKHRRMHFVQEMLTTFNDDPNFLKKVITADNLWVYAYDIETKVQSSNGKHFATIEEKKEKSK